MEDHEAYKTKYAESSYWLEKAKKKFAECTESGGSRAELEERLEKVQVGSFVDLIFAVFLTPAETIRMIRVVYFLFRYR